MAKQGNLLSRNPNLCASCSSLADGMDGGATESAGPIESRRLEPEPAVLVGPPKSDLAAVIG